MKFIINKDLGYVINYTKGKVYKSIGDDEGGSLSFLNDNNRIQHVLKADIIKVCSAAGIGTKLDISVLDGSIKLKYFDPNLPKLEITEKGDCIDLRVSKVYLMKSHSGLPMKDKEEVEFPYHYHNDDVLFFKLGVGMKLPEGFKANVYPRSSTFKNYGFILTNSVGIIDNSYCHEGDEWCAMVYCTREGTIEYGDRILQFEPVPVYTHNFIYEEVDELEEGARGAYGSTGVK